MGKADAAVRNWLSDKRRFADSDTRQGRWNKSGPEIQGYCHEMGRKNGSDVARSGIAG